MNQPWVKTHRILALLLGVFILSHLGIHLTALGGADMHIKVLSNVQPLYRNWIVEPLLIVAIIAQIFIGSKLLWRRWKQPQKTAWGWAQILSGIYIAIFLSIHSSAALITRYIIGLDTNFYWASATLNIAPLQYFFTPYYFFGVFSIFVHLAAAIHFGWEKSGKILSSLITVIGIFIGMLIILAFNGSLFAIDLPPEYIKLFTLTDDG
jgi:hypothetical protein